MKIFVLAALLIVFAAVVLANEVEEEEIQFRGWHFKRCKSDSDCRGGCCRKRRCSMRCTKYCKSEDDCDDGQCCVKGFRYGKCRSYLKEGDKCYKKSNFGLGMMKKSCGCEEGLECQIEKAFFFFRRRSGKCVTAEGSGET